MAKQLQIVAAIPNYNMAESLANLLPQVLQQGYDKIFVLDDASRDHSVDVVRQFGPDVSLLRSPENRGAGTNRNQIIGQVPDDSVIHFVDADMDLATSEIANVARELVMQYASRRVGVIGGLVRRLDGFQEAYNYGPVFALGTHLTTSFPPLIDRLRHRPELARLVGKAGSRTMRKWPDILGVPAPVETYWVHEGNMLISAAAFRAAGGYDPALREHEAQDLAIGLQKMGIKRFFDPSIEVVHHHVDVRGKLRIKKQADAASYIIRKHGIRRYLTEA